MLEGIIILEGKQPGPTSMIMAGIHGDEVCGIDALKKILPNLTIENGRVFFAFGNPRAIEQNKRFIDFNLNRFFIDSDNFSPQQKQSYEYGRAQFLKSYLIQADALLDLHASRTTNSKPFIICESNAIDLVSVFPVDLVVTGFDAVEPGGADGYMNNNDKIGVCVECGYFSGSESNKIAEEAVWSFLKSRGHVGGEIKTTNQIYARMEFLYKTKANFVPVKDFHDFEPVTKNQYIGTDGERKVKVFNDGLVLFVRHRQSPGEEGFLFGRYKNSLT